MPPPPQHRMHSFSIISFLLILGTALAFPYTPKYSSYEPEHYGGYGAPSHFGPAHYGGYGQPHYGQYTPYYGFPGFDKTRATYPYGGYPGKMGDFHHNHQQQNYGYGYEGPSY